MAFLIFAALTTSGCASLSDAEKSLVGTWHRSGNKTTVDDFDYFHQVLTLRVDGSFNNVHRQVIGRRDRSHPRPPTELNSVSEGTWRTLDGVFFQKTIRVGGEPLVPAQQRETQLHVIWLAENKIELRPTKTSETQGTIYVKGADGSP